VTAVVPEFFGANDYGSLLDPPDRDSGPSIGSSDFVCPYCEQALQWGGRGRKPKHCTPNNGGNPECDGPGMKRVSASGSSGTKRGTKNVESALAVMAGAYDQMQQALLFVSPDAADELERRIPQQQARNRAAFEANPALAARVAGWGGKGGTFFFLLSNAALVSAVMRVALPDVRAQRDLLTFLRGGKGSTGPTTAPSNLSDLFGAFGVPA
jgi:hypothetical protein